MHTMRSVAFLAVIVAASAQTCDIQTGLACAKSVEPCIATCKTGLEACAKCLAGDWAPCCPCLEKAIPKIPFKCPNSSAIVDLSNEPVLSVKIITEVNAAASWTAGINSRFDNYSIADMRALMGAQTSDLKDLPEIQHTAEAIAATPDSYDPRVSRKSCTGPVLDQAFCGSCWAFGATEAISDRLCISKGANAEFVQLAPLDLTSCDSGFFAGENGCQGGRLGGAWNYAKKTGLVTEACLPYLKSEGGPVPTCKPEDQPCLPESKFIPTPKCNKTCANGASWDSDKHKLGSVYNVPASQLKTELATNGPVESAFTVYADFVHYKTGVYAHTTGSQLGGHAIKIIGYGTDSGTDYWLVQNSWTTTWGDGGYFKIKAGGDECGIESQAIAGKF